MLATLNRIVRKLNISIILTILGLTLAIFALWFDYFGFRTDRADTRDTTVALERIEEMISSGELVFIAEYEEGSVPVAYEFKIPNGIGSASGTTESCHVWWKTEQNVEYILTEADDDEITLYVQDPALAHVMTAIPWDMEFPEPTESVSNVFTTDDDYLIRLDENQTEDSGDDVLELSADECPLFDFVFGTHCTGIELDRRNWSIFRSFDTVTFAPGEQYIADAIDGDLQRYRSAVQEIERIFRDRAARRWADFDAEYEKIRQARNGAQLGGVSGAESERTDRRTDQDENGRTDYRAYERSDGRKVISYLQVGEGYQFRYRHDPISDNLWSPTRSNMTFELILKPDQVSRAMLIRAECLKQPADSDPHLVVFAR